MTKNATFTAGTSLIIFRLIRIVLDLTNCKDQTEGLSANFALIFQYKSPITITNAKEKMKIKSKYLLAVPLVVLNMGCSDPDEAAPYYYRDAVSNKQQTTFEAANFVVTRPIPSDIVSMYNLDESYYSKYIDVWGFPILSSDEVDDVILQNAAEVIAKTLADNALQNAVDVRNSLYRHYFRVVIFPGNYNSSDVPEHKEIENALGLGAIKGNAVLSATESDLGYNASVGHKINNYLGITLIHELTHSIHYLYLKDADPSFDLKVQEKYAEAKSSELWPNTYMMSNWIEYLGAGSEVWFDRNEGALKIEDQTLATLDGYRQDLHEFLYHNDPALYDLLSEIYIPGGITNTDLSFQKGHVYTEFFKQLSDFPGDDNDKNNADNYEVETYTNGTLNEFLYMSPHTFKDAMFYNFHISLGRNISGFIEIPDIRQTVDQRYVFDDYSFKIKFKGKEIMACELTREDILNNLTSDGKFSCL